MTGRRASVLSAAALYFAVVFAGGFLLGLIRVPLLVPRLGERAAELVEAPFMLAVIVAGAWWVTRRTPAAPSPGAHLAVGGIALALLVLVEFTVVLALRKLTLAEYVAGRDPVAGLVYVALLVLFAAMPLLVRPRAAITPAG